MASTDNIYIASLTVLILLIKTHVCSFNTDETIVELHMKERNFSLKSSGMKTLRGQLCSSSYTFYQFKYESSELITQNISHSELHNSSHINFDCWYYLLGNEHEGIKCNQSKSSSESGTNNHTANMHFDCGETCVDILWVGVTRINLSSATRGKCAAMINTAISAAETTKGFISTTVRQPSWRTSTVPSTTSTVVPLYLAVSTSNFSTEVSLDPALPTSTTSTFPVDPTWPTSNTISIIAIIICACTLLLTLVLGIMYFAMKRNTEKHQHRTYNRFVPNSRNIHLSDVNSDGANSTQGQDNLDMQQSFQHATTSVVCTIAPSDTFAKRRVNDVVLGSAEEESNAINVYAIFREQTSGPSDTYDTLANVMDDLGSSMGTTSAETIYLRGDVAERVIVSEEESNATNIYATLRDQPSHTTETYDILRNVDKKVNPKKCSTTNNSHRRHETVDRNVLIHEVQLTDTCTDNNLIRKGVAPSTDSPVYSVVMKKSKPKS